jgi:hypothetical protein
MRVIMMFLERIGLVVVSTFRSLGGKERIGRRDRKARTGAYHVLFVVAAGTR